MVSLFKYRRVTTPGPDGSTIYFANSKNEIKAVEIAEIDGWYYVSVPDGADLPIQPESIEWQVVELNAELRAQIMASSRPVYLINQTVVEKIRAAYSIDDELKLLRTAPSAEFELYSAYVEDCRAWGREQKSMLGL